MATFKVGQRVRIVYPKATHRGCTATIWEICASVGIRDSDGASLGPRPVVCRVDVDGVGRKSLGGLWIAYEPHDLAPLTDPKADQFIEWVKKIKPEPVAVPVAELQRTK